MHLGGGTVFAIKAGVRQGCVLYSPPILLRIAMGYEGVSE